MPKERPFLVSVDLGEVAGPALDKLAKYRKVDRSGAIRECILVCYNFGLLKRFEGALRKAEKEKSPNVTKPAQNPATDIERDVIDKWREVFNYDGNIYWPKTLSVIRSAASKGVTHQDQKDIMELAANDSFVAKVISEGDLPLPSLILSDSMLAKFVPMLEEVRRESVMQDEIRLDGVIKPRALKELRGALSDDAMSKIYDLVMAATTEEQVANIVREALMAQYEDYTDNLSSEGVVGEWREKGSDGED